MEGQRLASSFRYILISEGVKAPCVNIVPVDCADYEISCLNRM
jgi:hypothetical protein